MDAKPKKPTLWRLAILLYPFAAAAVAINLFLLGLLGLAIGLPALSPWHAVLWALPLGLPATWAAAGWVRSLIAQAEA
jgi:hypothetical protein